MKQRYMRLVGRSVLIVLMALSVVDAAMATSPDVKHAIIGSIETVNKTVRTVSIKTADGTVETIKWTRKTSVHGLSEGAKAADLVGRTGSHIVVRYSDKGATKTANAVEILGSEALKFTQGTIRVAGKAAKTVVVTTADGAEQSFDLAERSVVETAHGAEDAVKFAASGATNDAKVTVHYVEKDGRRIAHFIKHL